MNKKNKYKELIKEIINILNLEIKKYKKNLDNRGRKKKNRI